MGSLQLSHILSIEWIVREWAKISNSLIKIKELYRSNWLSSNLRNHHNNNRISRLIAAITLPWKKIKLEIVLRGPTQVISCQVSLKRWDSTVLIQATMETSIKLLRCRNNKWERVDPVVRTSTQKILKSSSYLQDKLAKISKAQLRGNSQAKIYSNFNSSKWFNNNSWSSSKSSNSRYSSNNSYSSNSNNNNKFNRLWPIKNKWWMLNSKLKIWTQTSSGKWWINSNSNRLPCRWMVVAKARHHKSNQSNCSSNNRSIIDYKLYSKFSHF